MNNIENMAYSRKFIVIALFAVAFAYVEAAIVVYLRELIYPDGFAFPLRDFPVRLITIEVLRELATMIMLACAAAVCARRFWERFGWFVITFGIWDIFFYVWLKAIINWPSTITEWDILFLIPLPWIGPVIAPVLVSALMIVVGILITRRFYLGGSFKPVLGSWIVAVVATALILYSFMRDTDATLHQQLPQPYSYLLLSTGLVLYTVGFAVSYRSGRYR